MAQASQASEEVLDSQDYFRIFQELQSSGDIIEIDTSTKALFIGPQSDIARVTLPYYDPQATNSLRQVEVSVDNPFVGRLDALLATPIVNTGTAGPGIVATPSPARLLVSLNDIIDNSYVPYGTVLVNTVFVRVTPEIDFYAYFREPTNLAPVRADKTFLFSDISMGAGINTLIYLVPYYGRRFGRVIVSNQSGITPTLDFEVRGVRLAIGATSAAGGNKSAEVTLGSRIVAINGYADLETKASEDGSFDLLAVIFTTGAAFVFDDSRSLRIDVSDREA